MLLQSALATSSLWSQGPVAAAWGATERTLLLAERLQEADYQLRALYIQWIYRLRLGEYRCSHSLATRMRQIADAARDLPGALTAARLEGVSLHYLGNQERARQVMEDVTKQTSLDIHRAFVVRFGLDQRCAALVYLARILWLQGFPEQAVRTAQAAVNDAFAVNHANSLGIVLCDAACGVAAMCGNLQATQRLATKMVDGAQKHGLGMWLAYGLAFQGWVAIKRGAAGKGLRMLQGALNDFREIRVELRYTIFIEAVAQTLAHRGRAEEAVVIVGRVLEQARANDGHWCLPELLRIRAELFLADPRPHAAGSAEEMLHDALTVARQQGTRSWELRAATSLGRLWRTQGRTTEVRNLLLPIYQSFTEGLETADLRSARAVLGSLR
jgi:predicted ATPase